MRAGLIFLLLLSLASPAFGRDAHSIGEWLCGRLFEGDSVTLALAPDGFFGLKIAPAGKSVQNITGLWRLSPDGVELTLFNLQDAEIKMGVGKGVLHGAFANLGQVTLLPVQTKKAQFRITGLLETDGDKAILTDAASGRSFSVKPEPDAKNGQFAVVELEIGPGYLQTGQMLKHSRPVPRLYDFAHAPKGGQDFRKDVCGRFWLLPPMPGIDKASLLFAQPNANSENADLKGSFEVSGPGLRLEGTWLLSQDKLTLHASRANVRNLEIIGADELAKAVLGEFNWRLSSRGLELSGGAKPLLLLALN